MMLSPSRARPPRPQTQSAKPVAGQTKSYPAPTGGLVTNNTFPASQSAVVLENMWPTREGVEIRRGCVEQCTVPAAVVSLFEHRGSATFFAATTTAIYNFNSASTGALSAAVSGLTDGNWVTYEVQNSGGNFLLCVNGFDSLRRFDGTTWLTITGTGTGAITGPTTSTLSYVWGHRNRVFFVKKDTLSAYYLGTNSIAGAATELPLAAVFRKGGALMAGGTWSSDSGSGMDDRCVFVTTRGEVAIYAGSDPSDVNNWSLQGVYDVGVPSGRFSMQTVGGDMLFLTNDGVIPLSAVVSKDPSQLSGSAITAPISPTLRDDMDYRAGNWRLAKWDDGGALFVAPMEESDEPVNIYVANVETGAWAVFTGWEASDIRGLGSALYFGTRGGSIRRAWTGGTDANSSYVSRVMLAHDGLTDLAGTKTVGLIQAVFKTTGTLSYTMGAALDYSNSFGAPPSGNSTPASDAWSEWDIASWDVSDWGGGVGEYTIKTGWRGIKAVGFSVAPWVQVSSNSAAWVDAVLQRIDLTFIAGGTQP